MMDENVKALLDALRETQKMRDCFKTSADYWRDKAENLQIELDTIKRAYSNKPNGSEA